MNANATPFDVLARLQNMLDISESTSDAETGVDATFLPMPIEEFIASMRQAGAAFAALAGSLSALSDASCLDEDAFDSEELAEAKAKARSALIRFGGAA